MGPMKKKYNILKLLTYLHLGLREMQLIQNAESFYETLLAVISKYCH